jgi:hypothetical protein
MLFLRCCEGGVTKTFQLQKTKLVANGLLLRAPCEVEYAVAKRSRMAEKGAADAVISVHLIST